MSILSLIIINEATYHLKQTKINIVDMSVAVPCNWNKHPEQKHVIIMFKFYILTLWKVIYKFNLMNNLKIFTIYTQDLE